MIFNNRLKVLTKTNYGPVLDLMEYQLTKKNYHDMELQRTAMQKYKFQPK